MAGERERLEKLYEEMGDEHLMDLAAEPEDLTGDARVVLFAEMAKRGLEAPKPKGMFRGMGTGVEPGSVAVTADVEPEKEGGFGAGIPGVFPSGAAAVEMALEPNGEEVRGRVRLVSFYDGIELSRACKALEAAGIALEMEQLEGEPLEGIPSRYVIWVAAEEQAHGEAVLRKTMGLFPVGVEGAAENESGVVGQFDSHAEAVEVQRMLEDAGFRARAESGADTDEGWVVTVAPEEQERALEVLAARLGIE